MNTFFFNKKQDIHSSSMLTSLEVKTQPSIIKSDTTIQTTNSTITNEIGFIILRHVNSIKTNEYWKECYRCIRKFYTTNKILIIDDNSDQKYVTEYNQDNDDGVELTNTTIIQSEYPKRGELLPYYYYLKNKFCDIAVILHDSVFIQQPINFHVDEYKMLWHFHSSMMKDMQSSAKQIELINALNHQELSYMYEYFYLNKFNGCFGGMSVIRHSYLHEINSIFKIDKLLPHITCRVARCAFERVISFLLIYKNYGGGFYYKNKNKHQSLLGDIEKYCSWGITFEEYIKYRHSMKLPIVKVWTGR